MNAADTDRFFAKTKLATEVRPGMDTPCLEWTAGRLRAGYGQFRIGSMTDGSRRMENAQRVAWEVKHGPIPHGMHVLHKCDNPPCVAVEHLFLGTHADNMADKIAKGRQRGGGAYGDRNGSRLHPERLIHHCGSENGSAKLDYSDVQRVFELRALGWTQKRVADELGVSQSQISRINLRQNWAHVGI